ncbi:hypothetical protein BVY03_04485 [bacterium K02(2017)]|nr:hypothetical protein BVY03_04485 [bacterium K02(2017)]
MLEFLLSSANTPFMIALAIMLGIALLEGISSLFGFALSGIIDSFVPEIDTDFNVDVGVNVDVGMGTNVQVDVTDIQGNLNIGGEADSNLANLDINHIGHPTALSKLLGWFRIGKVPVLILFILFLFSFGMAGIIIQSTLFNVLGLTLPAWLISFPAVIISFYLLHYIGGLFEKFMPQDETDAVFSDSFIGRVAIITLGVSKKGEPAQAKLKDEHGKTHYVMVEPDNSDETFSSGSQVLLISKDESKFMVIKAEDSIKNSENLN